MLISKKKFEQEVQKRIRKEKRFVSIEERQRRQQDQIWKLRSKIQMLEERISEMETDMQVQRKGKITGYYMNPQEGCIYCTNEETTTEAQPEG